MAKVLSALVTSGAGILLLCVRAGLKGLARIEALGLDQRLEVKETRAILDALYETGDGGAAFLNDILEGNYIEYEYDKSLISLFKRFAAATLAYASEPIEEYYQEELRDFAGTLIGENYMNNLDIIEKYPPHVKEEETNE